MKLVDHRYRGKRASTGATLVLVLILALIPIVASAHSYADATTNPANCADVNFCVYVTLNYATGSGVYQSNVGEVDEWPEPWADSDDSAFNDWNATYFRAYEGTNQTGGFFCLWPNSGNKDLPFHHDNQGNSHKSFANC